MNIYNVWSTGKKHPRKETHYNSGNYLPREVAPALLLKSYKTGPETKVSLHTTPAGATPLEQ